MATVARAIAVHAACVAGLVVGWCIARDVYSANIVSDPLRVLSLLVIVESPVVIIAYSSLRSNKERTSVRIRANQPICAILFTITFFVVISWRNFIYQFLKAFGQGILGLPIGALINAFGAIILGAPFWIEYFKRTVSWSFLMSLFTFVPAVCVFGSSKKDWRRILDVSKMASSLDYMVSFPAYGAVIGGWFGAWPMPLDWERPWQEWPICVTYGAIVGYAVGILASLFCVLRGQTVHKKED